MEKSHFTVSGIGNVEDRTKLKNALNKISGVQETAVDMVRGTVEVGFNRFTSENEIKNCIEKTGYTVTSNSTE